MRAHFIRIAKTLRLIPQLTLKAGEPTFPMSPVSFAFAPLLGHQIERELVWIKLLGRLGDPGPLLFEQVGQRTRFLLAALRELRRYRRQSLSRYLFQSWDQVGDVLRHQRLDTRDGSAWRFPGVAERLLKLVQRLLLAALAEGAERPTIAFRTRSRSR